MATDVWLRGKGDGLKADVPTPVAFTIATTGIAARAIQVTRINRIAIISWVNQNVQGVRAVASPDGVLITTDKDRASRIALLGDWVVITAQNEVYTVQSTLFAAMFAVAPRKKRRSYPKP